MDLKIDDNDLNGDHMDEIVRNFIPRDITDALVQIANDRHDRVETLRNVKRIIIAYSKIQFINISLNDKLVGVMQRLSNYEEMITDFAKVRTVMRCVESGIGDPPSDP